MTCQPTANGILPPQLQPIIYPLPIISRSNLARVLALVRSTCKPPVCQLICLARSESGLLYQQMRCSQPPPLGGNPGCEVLWTSCMDFVYMLPVVYMHTAVRARVCMYPVRPLWCVSDRRTSVCVCLNSRHRRPSSAAFGVLVGLVGSHGPAKPTGISHTSFGGSLQCRSAPPPRPTRHAG